MQALTDIDTSRPVQVYRNLNKPGCQFSVRQGGKVRCYVDTIALTDCRFKHATPKQLSEVRTGARQVCQWITGMICQQESFRAFHEGMRISSDPKKSDGFTVDGARIDSAKLVVISKTGCLGYL